MRVNLRKADQAARALTEVARKISVDNEITLSMFDKQLAVSTAGGVQQRIATARAEAREKIETILQIYQTAYAIRATIKGANASSGIDNLLCERAGLEAQERALAAVLNADVITNDEDHASMVAAKLSGMKVRFETAASRYDFAETVEVPIFSQDDKAQLDDRRLLIRDRITRINDEVMQLNWGTLVTLSEEVVGVLDRHKIRVL